VITEVGFLGLGVMGRPMAENLASAFDGRVKVYDSDAERVAALSKHEAWGQRLSGARGLQDFAGCGVVVTMLPNSLITNQVILGHEGRPGLLQVLRPGAVVIDMGSSNPDDTQRLARRLEQAGLHFIDAPVSGAVTKARTGKLSIMIGGDDAIVERIRPLLECMGDTLIRTGRVGSAHALKALNNYVYAAGLLAVCEATALARSMGIDPQILATVLNASSGRNVASETKLAQHIIPAQFNAGFALHLQAKDLATADQVRRTAGVEAPQLSLCAALWADAERSLPPGADNTALYEFISTRSRDPGDRKEASAAV